MAFQVQIETVSGFPEAQADPSTNRYPDSLTFLLSRSSGGGFQTYRVSLGTLRKFYNPNYVPQES